MCRWGEKEREKIFHSKTAEYTFFSSAHGIFSRIDHILHHKINLGKLKIMSSIFSGHNTMRVQINYKKKKTEKKNTNMWSLDSMLLNNQ